MLLPVHSLEDVLKRKLGIKIDGRLGHANLELTIGIDEHLELRIHRLSSRV